MADPSTIDEWLSLAGQHEAAARKLAGARPTAAQGYWHAGMAIECALKAAIMHHERLNTWPSISSRRELYTHDVRDLFRLAGIQVQATDATAPAWHVALQWDRNQGVRSAANASKSGAVHDRVSIRKARGRDMAAPTLEVKYMDAGHEYLRTLRRFGLDPLALFWAYDHVAKQFVLVLVSEFFDVVGPLEISKLLFRAYNASVTPKSIDPFIIRLHSHTQPISMLMLHRTGHGVVGKPGPDVAIAGGTIGGMELKAEWLIASRDYTGKSTVDLVGRWDRIGRTLSKMAA